MIEGKSVLAVILARGGSKTVPGKNLREVAGKPLVAWSIEAGLGSKHIDRLILSSDDIQIQTLARHWGCEVPFTRPAALATDEAPTGETLAHAIQALPEVYDYVVLLQPTSPLRTSSDIDECLGKCVRLGAPACVTVSAPEQSPYLAYRLGDHDRIQPLISRDERWHRRQDLPRVCTLNGAVYAAEVPRFLEACSFFFEQTVGLVMPPERAVDVDTELDLIMVEAILARLRETTERPDARGAAEGSRAVPR